MAVAPLRSNPDDEHRRLLDQYTEIATLAGGLAHEIRNPLSTLNLNLQLLAEDFQNAQSQQERRALQKIELLQKECHRLEEILDHFLRYARICELDLVPCDISQTVGEMVEFFAPQASAANVLVRDDLPRDLPQVPLDRDFFKQALLNLFLNAVQAMPNGGELILRARADGDRVCVDVIDTGIGMSPETIEQMYRPFYSTRKAGSGLGLPTTKKIIEAHHGRLLVDSEPGKGTAFTIQLPRAAEGS